GTLAYALRDSGRKILLLERGDFLPKEPENWSPEAVFDRKRYKPAELWHDDTGKPFNPGVHYFVGGNTKVYGAALPRLREQDFELLEHEVGISPAWPIRYRELSPYYDRAEEIFWVHGELGSDPTDPPRTKPFPFPPLAHEPYIEDLRLRLAKQGLHPFYIPMGVDWREGGSCIRCRTCDGFPCQVSAKADTETNCVGPALQSGSIALWTRSFVRRLRTDPTGRTVVSAEVEKDGQTAEVRAETFVLSCGAANSAAVLLRSANSTHPHGLANGSGLVGRNYMVHNNTALMAIDPFRKNLTTFQKTMGVNDFYLHGEGDHRYPLGNLQLLGKLQAGMLTANQRWVPRPILAGLAQRSVDWWVMSEDLPDPGNRVTIDSNGGIVVRWKPTNLQAHIRLIDAGVRMLRRAGYSIVLTQRMGIETNSHQCGTARFGSDPATSVLDPVCRTHEVKNLFVVDSSFFPSSAAVNPALTIAAQALRVADHIMGGNRISTSGSGSRNTESATANPNR
ncbi:MAG TPA: GMC family oxidoreductase, partial [Chthoniobacterales bacterium]|nr:GMC family oxidoreductase [Chthoniobacterales bacterium]